MSCREVGRGRSKRLHIRRLLPVVLLLCVVGSAGADDETVILTPRGSVPRKIVSKPDGVSLPFYVHNNAIKPPPRNFAASGYMGDTSCLRVMGAYTNVLQAGVPCIKVVYVTGGLGGWAGLVWQNPPDNWGDKPRGGYNLIEAKRIEFSACGGEGGEIVEFKIGGAGGEYPVTATVSTGPIPLKKEWTRFVLDLGGADLRYISSGFGFVVTESDNPNGCTFYLDNIGYFD